MSDLGVKILLFAISADSCSLWIASLCASSVWIVTFGQWTFIKKHFQLEENYVLPENFFHLFLPRETRVMGLDMILYFLNIKHLEQSRTQNPYEGKPVPMKYQRRPSFLHLEPSLRQLSFLIIFLSLSVGCVCSVLQPRRSWLSVEQCRGGERVLASHFLAPRGLRT